LFFKEDDIIKKNSVISFTNEKGFTLVELLVVIVIIGILASIAIPQFMGATTKAKLSEFKPVLKQAVVEYNAYYQEHDTYVTPTGDISNGNPDIGFSLPSGESRFDYSSVESENGVIVTARLKKDVLPYKEGMAADLNEKLEKNTVSKDIPW
jgi:prepilin-type N-terminal cleavage/methylation domain-containing protein